MADQVQTQLSPEESYNILVAQVHAPIFFKKLASVYGIAPQTQEEARELLLMAGQLRNAHEQDGTKQAAARGSYFAEARRDLGTVLTQQGFHPLSEDDAHVKNAAAEAAQNPLIKEAAVIFSNYLAQAVQAK